MTDLSDERGARSAWILVYRARIGPPRGNDVGHRPAWHDQRSATERSTRDWWMESSWCPEHAAVPSVAGCETDRAGRWLGTRPTKRDDSTPDLQFLWSCVRPCVRCRQHQRVVKVSRSQSTPQDHATSTSGARARGASPVEDTTAFLLVMASSVDDTALSSKLREAAVKTELKAKVFYDIARPRRPPLASKRRKVQQKKVRREVSRTEKN